MKVKLNTKMVGIYTFNVSSKGAVSKSYNLIVNSGLDSMGTNINLLTTCLVGTGSDAVKASDTGLKNQVAKTTSIQSVDRGSSTSDPYFSWVRKTFRFEQGIATGNLKEVGINTENGKLFSRALITDEEGNPTTLTVLPDEYLDVTYELRTYFTKEDLTQTLNVNGTVYTITMRPSKITSVPAFQEFGIDYDLKTQSSHFIYSGVIGDIFNTPTGDVFSHARAIKGAYVKGSYERTFILKAGLNNANYTEGIKSLHLDTTQGSFQVGFNPAIPKNNTSILNVEVSIGWGK